MPRSKRKAETLCTRRFQPLRIKQSKLGGGIRSDQVTAWLNYQAYTLFRRHTHVHMTKSFDAHHPTIAKTNFAADVMLYEKDSPDQSFDDIYTSTDEQRQYEIFCPSLSTDKYHVSVSKKAFALIKRVSKNTQRMSRETVIFLKMYEDDHYSALLYYPYSKRVEMFDASGSGFTMAHLKDVLYNTLHLLFGVRYNQKRYAKKLTVVTTVGYQQSVFDEYCQTWVYFYLYKRLFCEYSVDDWKSYIKGYSRKKRRVNTDIDEKHAVGFDGLEASNPYRKRLKLITHFRDWFMHTSMASVKK